MQKGTQRLNSRVWGSWGSFQSLATTVTFPDLFSIVSGTKVHLGYDEYRFRGKEVQINDMDRSLQKREQNSGTVVEGRYGIEKYFFFLFLKHLQGDLSSKNKFGRLKVRGMNCMFLRMIHLIVNTGGLQFLTHQQLSNLRQIISLLESQLKI